MAATKWFLSVFIIVSLVELASCKKIKILSDFDSLKDKEFFKTTFPWIVNNVGYSLRVEYYFKDQDGGKRMCVLENLKRNLYLQADYLKCEADNGNNCLKTLPLDQRKLEKCYRKSHKKIRAAEKEFRKHGSNETPLVVQGRSQQSAHDPKALLKYICGLFGRKRPQGCDAKEPLNALVPGSQATTESGTEANTKPSTEPVSSTTV